MQAEVSRRWTWSVSLLWFWCTLSGDVGHQPLVGIEA